MHEVMSPGNLLCSRPTRQRPELGSHHLLVIEPASVIAEKAAMDSSSSIDRFFLNLDRPIFGYRASPVETIVRGATDWVTSEYWRLHVQVCGGPRGGGCSRRANLRAHRGISGSFSYADGADQWHPLVCSRRWPRTGRGLAARLWGYWRHVGAARCGVGEGSHRHRP